MNEEEREKEKDLVSRQIQGVTVDDLITRSEQMGYISRKAPYSEKRKFIVSMLEELERDGLVRHYVVKDIEP